MASKTEICNMALLHVGAKTVDNVDTENSAEAIACRNFYDIARDALLRYAEWPFATTQEDLGLVAEDPDDEWQFSYQYPANAVRFIEVVNPLGITSATISSQQTVITPSIPAVIRYGTSGREIYTNQEDAIGRYIYYVTETGRFPPDFTLALSYFVGSLIAPKIVGSEAYGIAGPVKNLSDQWMRIAAAYSYNEECVIEPNDSTLLRSRA